MICNLKGLFQASTTHKHWNLACKLSFYREACKLMFYIRDFKSVHYWKEMQIHVALTECDPAFPDVPLGCNTAPWPWWSPFLEDDNTTQRQLRLGSPGAGKPLSLC